MKLFTELPKYAAYCCKPSTIGLCVTLSQSWALQKRLNRSKYRLGCELGWALLPRNYILMAVQIPKRKGGLWGEWTAQDMLGRSIFSKRHNRGQNRYGADADWNVPDGVHIGATWRIRLNRPCAAAMRPYVRWRCALVALLCGACVLVVCQEVLRWRCVSVSCSVLPSPCWPLQRCAARVAFCKSSRTHFTRPRGLFIRIDASGWTTDGVLIY